MKDEGTAIVIAPWARRTRDKGAPSRGTNEHGAFCSGVILCPRVCPIRAEARVEGAERQSATCNDSLSPPWPSGTHETRRCVPFFQAPKVHTRAEGGPLVQLAEFQPWVAVTRPLGVPAVAYLRAVYPPNPPAQSGARARQKRMGQTQKFYHVLTGGKGHAGHKFLAARVVKQKR